MELPNISPTTLAALWIASLLVMFPLSLLWLRYGVRPVLDAAAELVDLVQPGAEVRRGGKSQPIVRFADAHGWLMDEAKRGRTVQRFKGLGEMNPEQLWETTVNPETRRLLQVRIEDAVAADQIFSTLMGDVVDAIEACSGHVLTTHLHDNRGRNDDHLVPGQGVVDWDAATLAFQKVGYDGAWMFELAVAAERRPVLERARGLARRR